MNVYLNKITGIEEAIVSMFMSKRTWTRELEIEVFDTCGRIFDRNGNVYEATNAVDWVKFSDWMNKLTKWGRCHITMLKYINISVTVEGLHRGGQDDWDSHAKRFDNRIIRSSTRLVEFDYEMSDFYRGKILPTDYVLEQLGVEVPQVYETNGIKFVKTVNGYIREDLKDDKDVKRGLYMLSIPSTFTFQVNLAEWAHVYKERNTDSTANPEVKEVAEAIADALEGKFIWFNRELWKEVRN